MKRKSKTFHWDFDDPLFQISSEDALTITELCFKIDLTNLHTQLQRAATIAKKCKQLKVLRFTQMNLDNQIISYPHGPRLIRSLAKTSLKRTIEVVKDISKECTKLSYVVIVSEFGLLS